MQTPHLRASRTGEAFCQGSEVPVARLHASKPFSSCAQLAKGVLWLGERAKVAHLHARALRKVLAHPANSSGRVIMVSPALLGMVYLQPQIAWLAGLAGVIVAGCVLV